MWLRVQRHVEDDSQVFLHSVQKVADVATNPSQNVLLVQVLYNEVCEMQLNYAACHKYTGRCSQLVRLQRAPNYND